MNKIRTFHLDDEIKVGLMLRSPYSDTILEVYRIEKERGKERLTMRDPVTKEIYPGWWRKNLRGWYYV